MSGFSEIVVGAWIRSGGAAEPPAGAVASKSAYQQGFDLRLVPKAL